MPTTTSILRAMAVEIAGRSGYHVSCEDSVVVEDGGRLYINGKRVVLPNPSPTPEHLAYMRHRGWPIPEVQPAMPVLSLSELADVMREFNRASVRYLHVRDPREFDEARSKVVSWFALRGVKLAVTDD
jgi:hypothetical protein